MTIGQVLFYFDADTVHWQQLLVINWLRKYLTGIPSSLEKSSANHAISDHAGVGVVTVFVGQDGEVQTLQEKRVEH